MNPPPTPAPTITVTREAPPPAPVAIAPPPAPAAPPAPPAPPRQAARPAIANVQACAPKNEDYPAAAVRTEATGTTRISFVRSAGPTREHTMLDRLAQAKLSECQFRAGADENGRPMGGSFEVEYVWKLD